MGAVIELEGVTATQRDRDGGVVESLDHVDLSIERGEMVAVTGPLGSGTGTLLNILGGLAVPAEGRYRLDGTDVGRLSTRRLTRLRGRLIGFVFPAFALVADATVLRNVELPLMYTRRGKRLRRAREALERVGLATHHADMPVELFDAQRDKVFVARALINDPPILLYDNPTRHLDADSASQIMHLLTELNHAGRTVIYYTSDPDVAQHANRVLTLHDGRITSDTTTDPTS